MANQTELVGNSLGSGSLKRIGSNETHALNVNQEENFCSFTANYTGAQTNLDIITPASGERLHVCGIYTNTATTQGDINLRFVTSGKTVLYLHTTTQTRDAIQPIHIDGAINEPLTLDCGANTFIAVCYCCHC